MDLNAPLGELPRNEIGGLPFLVGELRMAVQLSPPGNRFCDVIRAQHDVAHENTCTKLRLVYARNGREQSLLDGQAGRVVQEVLA